MKLGILGGTFNPIHCGHLALAAAARTAHSIERVLLVPSRRPPHKVKDLAPAADRLAMVKVAVEAEEGLEASAIEMNRPGVSYTVDTLEEISGSYPSAELFFLIGADSVPELRSWRRLPRIFELARIVVVNRPGYPIDLKPADFPDVPPAAVERCRRDLVTMEPVALSSTSIRQAARRGEPLAGQVPPQVERYLRERRLYARG